METTPVRSYDVPIMPLPSITWQDVQQMPDDGNRYEAIEGDLYMTPAPTFRHQLVSWRLSRALDRFLFEAGHGLVLCAPFGVEFPATDEGVQPDILFVSGERREIIAEAGIVGAPDLVMEILSPSTAGRDRSIKLRLYERQGVREGRASELFVAAAGIRAPGHPFYRALEGLLASAGFDGWCEETCAAHYAQRLGRPSTCGASGRKPSMSASGRPSRSGSEPNRSAQVVPGGLGRGVGDRDAEPCGSGEAGPEAAEEGVQR